MTKSEMIRSSNIALLICFIVQVFTSLVLYFEIKPLDGEVMEKVHVYNGMLMIALVVVHIALHWPAVRAMLFKRK